MDGNLRLRKIEVPRGPSEVGTQYGIRGVPTLWLYQGDELLSTDRTEVLEMLKRR